MSNMASNSQPTKEQSTFITSEPEAARSTVDGLHSAAGVQSTVNTAQPGEDISVEDDQGVGKSPLEIESLEYRKCISLLWRFRLWMRQTLHLAIATMQADIVQASLLRYTIMCMRTDGGTIRIGEARTSIRMMRKSKVCYGVSMQTAHILMILVRSFGPSTSHLEDDQERRLVYCTATESARGSRPWHRYRYLGVGYG